MKMNLNKKLTISFLIVILISVGVIALLIRQTTVYNFWGYLHGNSGMGGMGGMMGRGGMNWGTIGNQMGNPEKRYLGSVYSSLWWGVVVAGMVGLVISAYFSKKLTNPLKKLSLAAKAISDGDLSQRVPVDTHDEIGEVAISFNEMADSLEKNENLRQHFLVDIAHELRTPLTIIQGNLESILDGVIEPNREHVASIYDECLRLSRLVVNLRDISLAEAGYLQLDKKTTNLTQLMQTVTQLLIPATDEKGIQLKVQAPEKAIVMADPDRINQVLYNLLINSISYTPKDGIITISIQEKEQSYQVSVQDNGQGIPEEDQPFIFEHFYRADKSRTKSSGGTGIGLAIVKQLVEAHGGQISVASKLNIGTTITFSLPKKDIATK